MERHNYVYLAPLVATVPTIQHVYTWPRYPHGLSFVPFVEMARCHTTILITELHLIVANVAFDIDQPWITVEPRHAADVIVSVTPRYHDQEEIHWSLLKGLDVGFIGQDEDYTWFRDKTRLDMKRVYVENALETAQYIKGSRLFLGNQSSSFAIAEAMKHPRVLEVFYGWPNCMPQGPKGHTWLTQDLISHYLDKDVDYVTHGRVRRRRSGMPRLPWHR